MLIKGEESFIRGADALNYVIDQVELKHPEYIKFPKMRKYLATVVQVRSFFYILS